MGQQDAGPAATSLNGPMCLCLPFFHHPDFHPGAPLGNSLQLQNTPYLHSLLIKKGKETPRALTTRGKKQGKKEKKEKEKGKGKEKGELFELVKSKGQSLMGQKRRNEKNMESPKMVSSF